MLSIFKMCYFFLNHFPPSLNTHYFTHLMTDIHGHGHTGTGLRESERGIHHEVCERMFHACGKSHPAAPQLNQQCLSFMH